MQCINLQTSDIDSLRRRVEQGGLAPFREIRPSGITLPALLELVCSLWMWSHSAPRLYEPIIDGWSQNLLDLEHARRLLASGPGSRENPAPFGAPRKEALAHSIEGRLDRRCRLPIPRQIQKDP